MPGVPERRTHSYVRHGTTSLFAALDVASGFVIGKCYITKIPGPSNGPNLPTKSWLQLDASATKRSKHYAANFRFT
jgi:hypothetical protein